MRADTKESLGLSRELPLWKGQAVLTNHPPGRAWWPQGCCRVQSPSTLPYDWMPYGYSTKPLKRVPSPSWSELSEYIADAISKIILEPFYFFPHPNNLNPSLLSTSQSLSLHLHKIPQMFLSLTLKGVERCKYSWHLSDGSLEQNKWQQLSFLMQGRGVKQLLAHNTDPQPWNHGFLTQPDHMVKTEGTNSV